MQTYQEKFIKLKYKEYQNYLRSLDDEFLAYEFNDRMGCDPFDHFCNAMNAENTSKWIDALEDWAANTLYDNPDETIVNYEYLEQCR